MRLMLPLVLLALPLAACAGTDRPSPSLDRRPAERISGTALPAATTATQPDRPPPSGELTARLAVLRREAQAAHATFINAELAATRAVAAARRSSIASESWSVAQVALAELDSARSRAMIALADLDSMLVAAAVTDADAPSGDLPAIEAAHRDVSAWVSEEDAVLQRLHGQLAG